MTFTFKLSRRLAISHVVSMLLAFPALFLVTACTNGDLPTTATDPTVSGSDVAVDLKARGRGRNKVRLSLSPDTAVVAPDSTRHFTATLRANDGSLVTDTLRWAATGGSVTAAGVYTAGKVAGKYHVIASGVTTGAADTADVLVADTTSAVPPAPPAALASVVLTPASVSLQTGATQQFAAAGLATDGSSIAVSLVWTATGGTVSSSGLYTAGTAGGTFRVIATDGPSGKADTAQVTLTVPTSSPSPAPSGAVPLYPGDDLASAVSARPAGTQFLIKAGVHRRQTIRPKDGMGFYGESGAVLDGEKVASYAFETLTSAPRAVVIKGLVIQNYVPPTQRSAIQGDNGIDWLVQGNEIRYNGEHGLRLGKNTKAIGNFVHHNAKVGIACYKCDNALVEGNEVSYNNTANLSETAILAEASGIKLVLMHNAVVRNNHVHHNTAKGIWFDNAYLNAVIEGNNVHDNSSAGIWHEASYNAIIRNNTSIRNGGTSSSWLSNSCIQVSNSPNVEIYGNTVGWCANGIGIMNASGYPTTGPYGTKIVQNLYVHDNVITMVRGYTGLVQNIGDNSLFTSRNNRFVRNAYTLGTNATYFHWNNQAMTESQWRAAGNDVTGTFAR